LYRYKKSFIVSGITKAINSIVQFFPSILLSKLLKLINSGTLKTHNPLAIKQSVMLALLLLLSLCTKTIIENMYFDMVTNLAAQVRGTLSAAIYQKALKLGPQGRQNVTVSFFFFLFYLIYF
jgi:ABC-type transport system involved in cytochrome bd biosynthesis fused ATPase/permease subunit